MDGRVTLFNEVNCPEMLQVNRADRPRRGFAAKSLCLILAVIAAQASAATLDPAHVGGNIFFNLQPPLPINFNTFGVFSQTGPGGFIQYSATGTPSPALSAEANISPGFSGRASGTLTYGMEVLGPAGREVSVKVDVSGGATGSSSHELFTAFSLKALWRIDDANLGLHTVFGEGIDTPALQGTFNQTFGHTIDLTLIAGHVYGITMVADVFAGAVDSGTRTFGSAFIDPVFSFATGVGPEFSFRFSDGIGNSSPVPLPGAFGLLSAATALIGVRTRSRRRLARTL